MVPGRGGADIGEPLNYSTTIAIPKKTGWSKRGRFVVPRTAEEWSGAGKGWGRHWGAFKLLYYHCNTTKIDRVEQPRTVCGAEEAEECGVVPARGGADIGEPLNYSTTIAMPLK